MDQYETAANIEINVNVSENSSVSGNEKDQVTIPVASIDGSKEVNIEEIKNNNVKTDGFALTEINYSGSVEFEGNGFVEVGDSVVHLEELFTDDQGYPVDGSELVIFHEGATVNGGNAKQTVYDDVMITSDAYESSSGEVSGVTFDWIAGDRVREDVDE